MSQKKQKVAILTAGGLAPCLSSAVGSLIQRYSELAPELEIIGYLGGYKGLLLGSSVAVTPEVRAGAGVLHKHGGSPIGNSRVKLTNRKDCVKRGLVKEGEDPLEVAARQLSKDGVTILHTVGGDDTNTTAADLAAFLKQHDYDLTVVGLPKTIDNDVFPIRQSLGAWTAAEQGAIYFENIVNEHSANPRMLIVHEVMGRNCGWLTAYTAKVYRQRLNHPDFLPGFNLARAHKDVDAVYIPELDFDLEGEAKRLSKVMDEQDCVNLFVSEGACVNEIVKEMTAKGEEVPRDAFGHYKLDAVNVGQWFSKQFAKLLGAEKTLVQKSGYFARAAAANIEDQRLIQSMVDHAVECALRGESGVIGHDENQGGRLRAIEFPRIAGGKPFNVNEPWFDEMLAEIKQPKGRAIAVDHHHGEEIPSIPPPAV
ncbi:MAG TPA: pyrophosphate--fructose-6-phosphate 1-phosphotransferase [Polyangiaceae bacterium]|nr:pyrophosphate--fructose-6-phosphate 1-phosphotransferase [Polyangiaceae bacterium]